MPLEVSRFSFYLVTWHFSDLISMREVMPLMLASPAPGHGSSLSPPVSSCRDGQKRSAAALGASSSNALLCPAKARVRAHTRTHAHMLSRCCAAMALLGAQCASPSWLADHSWGWPDLSGIWFRGVGERLRHPAIDAWGAGEGMEKCEAWGPGWAARHRLRVRLHRLLLQRSDGPTSHIAATLFPRAQDFRRGFCFVKIAHGKREGGTCAFYKSCSWICPLGWARLSVCQKEGGESCSERILAEGLKSGSQCTNAL